MDKDPKQIAKDIIETLKGFSVEERIKIINSIRESICCHCGDEVKNCDCWW